MQHRDYFERLIQQIADAAAQIGALVREGRLDEAEQAVDAAWSSALNVKRYDVQRLNDATVRLLLGAKAPYATALFEAQATIEEARGATAAAAALRQRAADLR
ncbi:MAG TPA: hypothetical protein VH044_06885 [Polyangiaceae bacterium]|jgi:hypothetical protein|nr:hypothetical protein [Polyangiaceae bacterium]